MLNLLKKMRKSLYWLSIILFVFSLLFAYKLLPDNPYVFVFMYSNLTTIILAYVLYVGIGLYNYKQYKNDKIVYAGKEKLLSFKEIMKENWFYFVIMLLLFIKYKIELNVLNIVFYIVSIIFILTPVYLKQYYHMNT